MRGRPLGRPYWTIWTAGAISFTGDGIMFGALPLLAASITRDPRIVSLTEAVTGAGWLLLGLLSGVMVDRWRRTSTLRIVDAIRAVIAGAFAAAVLAGLESIPLLLVSGFLLGMLAPFFDNASSVVVPPLGAVGAGFLAHRTGLRTPYLVMGLVQVAAAVAFAPLIRREVRREVLTVSADAGGAG